MDATDDLIAPTFDPGLRFVGPDNLDDLHESPLNPRHLSDEAKERLRYSLQQDPAMLKARPVICTLTGETVAGNMRLRVAKELGIGLWVFFEDLDEKRKREWMLRDNQAYGEWVPAELAALVAAHADDDGDMALLGFAETEVDDLLALNNAAGDDGSGGLGAAAGAGSLADRFLVPPFTVLDMRRGTWRDRKRDWLRVLPKSSEGRDDLDQTAFAAESSSDPRFYEKKRQAESDLGRSLTTAEFLADHYQPVPESSSLDPGRTSIFDPVLCELVYRWWSMTGDTVLDPFAGGSVRGLVAAKLGRDYLGVDLRPEQVDANLAHAEAATNVADDGAWPGSALWRVGDAVALTGVIEPVYTAGTYDLVFSCPPYYDLEQYSDDPADLSRVPTYERFLEGYGAAIHQAVAALAPDRFAAWVVGDVRDKQGRLRPFIADTIQAFESAGAQLYNSAIMVTPIGSVRILAAKQFVASRKLGRTHQHLLTFVKGDPRVATERLGDVDVEAVVAAVDGEE